MTARYRGATTKALASSLLLCCLLAACSEVPTPTAGEATDPDVLASWNDGEIRRADVDRAILAMPSDQRANADKGESWYLQLVRELALDRMLLEEAETVALAEEPAVRFALDEARRQLLAGLFQARHQPAREPVTEETLRALYDQARDRFDLEAGRRVRHLFKRRDPERTVDEQRLEVEALRQRILSGDSFSRLAREHSDSESRHSDGVLGLLRPKDLPPALADTIFSLPEGTPSEPIVTQEGVHLFLVEKAYEQKQFTFAEVRSVLENEEQQRRHARALGTAIDALPPLPEGSFRATEAQLLDGMERGTLDTVVLRAGDFELRLGALSERMSRQKVPLTPEAASLNLEQLEQRERIVRYALADGWLEQPEARSRWRHLVERELIRVQRERRLEQFLDQQPKVLRAFYDLDALRFSPPVRLRLRVLGVPFSAQDQVNTLMQRLEGAAVDQRSLDALATEYHGTIEELDWISIPDLAAAQPRLARLVANLEPGGRAAPLLGDQRFLIAEVAERLAPERLPFSQVLDEVRHAYLENHAQDVYNGWAEERTKSARLRLHAEAIRLLMPPGLSS